MYVWIISEAGDHEALRTPVGGFTLRPNFTPTCITHPETYLNKVESPYVRRFAVKFEHAYRLNCCFILPAHFIQLGALQCAFSWVCVRTCIQVLIGSEEGSLQLWNISTGNLVFEFKGWQTPVRCCVASPALDVVGIGCGDGRLQLHNLKYNETVVSFLHSARGSVTAVSFRTGAPHIAL